MECISGDPTLNQTVNLSTVPGPLVREPVTRFLLLSVHCQDLCGLRVSVRVSWVSDYCSIVLGRGVRSTRCLVPYFVYLRTTHSG